jgi:aminoglycoside/choline kinase family phosphotransferase
MALPEPTIATAPEELSANWLTAALRTGGLHGTVRRVVDVRTVGTGQMATCYRITVESDGDVPPSLIAKVPTPSASEMSATAYRNEINFYRHLAPYVRARVPHCHYAEIAAGGLPFVLLLEDLAPAAQGDQIAGCSVDDAVAAVANLADVHGPLWGHPAIDAFAAAAGPTDPGLLLQFLSWGTDEFLQRYDGRVAAPHERVLREFCEVATGFRAGQPEAGSVQHGDYRLDNLLFGRGDDGTTCAVVDWQTACVGPPLHDLAFFVSTGLPTELRRTPERSLVETYARRLREHGVDRRGADLWDDYRFGQGHGVVITVLGAIAAPRTPRGDDMFMAMADRVCTAIDDLDVLALYR